MTAILLGLAPAAFAQSAGSQDNLAPHPAAVNQTDNNGKKQGFWWLDIPARMGESAATQFGTFLNSLRSGMWYSMDGMGELTAIERYSNDVLDGEVKYFENGALTIIGHYLGLSPTNKYDTIIVTDPVSGEQGERIIPTDRGAVRHGTWRYYNPYNGQLEREEEYQADELLGTQTFLAKADSAALKRRDAALPHNLPGGKKAYRVGHQFDPYKR